MNIDEIKKVIISGLPLDFVEREIVNIIAKDKNVIPTILKILNSEREVKNNLITDMNLELSRALSFISENPEIETKEKKRFNKVFVVEKSKEFYDKYSNVVTNLFKR